MKIELFKTPIEEKEILVELLLEYFKEIDNSKVRKTEKGEVIDYEYLDLYWLEPNLTPFTVVINEEIIGFVLLNNWTLNKEFNADKTIAEFYVKPHFRRSGVGTKVAYKLFEIYKGKWEVRQSITNISAVKFWRKIIGDYTKGYFKEVKTDNEIMQLFELR